jgi:alpha-beta hydrolase superfamily lysophospholipase
VPQIRGLQALVGVEPRGYLPRHRKHRREDQFRSDLVIRDAHVPVLIVHGDEDRVTPISFAKRLFECANEPKTFISVAGGGHLMLGLPEVFARDLDLLLDRHS